MHLKKPVWIVLLLLTSGVAAADCALNGVVYSEGSQVGDYECSNGEWTKREE